MFGLKTLLTHCFVLAEDYELLSDRLDADGGTAVNDGEEPEEEFEAYFDPLNEVDLKVSIWILRSLLIRLVTRFVSCTGAIPQALQNITANASVLQAIMPELTAADKEALAAVSVLSS